MQGVEALYKGSCIRRAIYLILEGTTALKHRSSFPKQAAEVYTELDAV